MQNIEQLVMVMGLYLLTAVINSKYQHMNNRRNNDSNKLFKNGRHVFFVASDVK